MSNTATAAPPATAITWFEIPATDLARAQRFYEAILEAPMRSVTFEGENIVIFPCAEGGVAGCLLESAHPSPHGTRVFLNVDGRLDRTLELIAANGGRIEEPKHELPNIGSVASIVDSEGNRVGLHAMK